MINGILNVYKEKGFTSHDVVAKLRGILHQKKIGHTGTLDPDAEGVLPICLGTATKLCDMLTDKSKTYHTVFKLGVVTDTQDITGTVQEENAVVCTEQQILDTIMSFVGKYEQVPPMYSAKKVNGKKLYEYARKGVEVEIPKRKIEIYNIELLNINEKEQTIEFKVHCSKGTYIRSLCSDIAKKLGTIGCMSDLERLCVGRFDITESITLETINNNIENINNNLITIERLFDKSKNIILEDKKLKLFLNGVQLKVKEKDGAFKIYNNNKFIGIGCIKDNILKRDIIII